MRILFEGLRPRGRRWRNRNWSMTPRTRAPPPTSPSPSTTKVATNVRNYDLLDMLLILQCPLHFSDLSVQYQRLQSEQSQSTDLDDHAVEPGGQQGHLLQGGRGVFHCGHGQRRLQAVLGMLRCRL